MRAQLIKSPKADKKYRIVFTDKDGEKKHIDFGAAGMGDYPHFYKQSPEIGETRKRAYLKRHAAREDWNKYDTAGAAARWVLWNLPSVEASFADYKRRFRLD